MIKNLKLATIWGVILWVLIFVVVSVVMFGLPSVSVAVQNIISLGLIPLLILFAGRMYFREVPADAKDGLLLGVYWLIVGVILDALITVPIFVKDYSFFYRWDMLVGYLEFMVFSVVAVNLFSKGTGEGQV